MFPSSPPGFLPSVRPSSLVRPRVSRVKQVLTMAGLGFPDPRSPPRSPGRSEQIPLSYSGSAVERRTVTHNLPLGGRPARAGYALRVPPFLCSCTWDIVASGGGGPLRRTLPQVHALSLSVHSSRRQHLG